MQYLVIVESPAKAKTIEKYLGKNYQVMASNGHLRDLPKSSMGVDLEHDFEPNYITIRGKGELLTKLKKRAKTAEKVFLATDPDREGEAISWHLAKALGVPESKTCRIAFNEITKKAVQSAVKSPRNINQDLVDAQQARRVLDRIVGYKISPILWKKVKKGLSAGRVQSVATRLIVDRERDIERFVPQEYWTITSNLSKGKDSFNANFFGTNTKMELPDEKVVQGILDEIEGKKYIVKSVKEGVRERTPTPPFITSTLQQEASRKLNYTAKKTMALAQQLYEGVNVPGHGSIGLITYMRTDSLRVSDDAVASARSFIEATYGTTFLPEKPRIFKTKKSAQDAHEAIRPTNVDITPASLKGVLEAGLFKLYKLIWERFIASQMSNAVYDTISADISVDKYIFKAKGSKVKFQGFMKLYTEGRDSSEEEDGMLPKLVDGEELKHIKTDTKQHFTQPPSRYTEATLIKTMEEDGIGRPSTYAPTIATILGRGYIRREGKTLFPTELGIIITDLMLEHFSNIVNVDFTANMEEQLDKVEEGETAWKSIIREFYEPFKNTLEKAEELIGDVELKDEVSDIQCEKCGRMMVYKFGRFGKFLACPGFPECRNAKPIIRETGVNCPDCGGKILIKKSKKGKDYYGCENNPECALMLWDMPIDKKCPQCGKIMVKRRNGEFCSDKECK